LAENGKGDAFGNDFAETRECGPQFGHRKCNGLHGFGCVLVKSEVFKNIPYPQFVYKSAIDHKDTISEDVYFCTQARRHGFTLWCDTDVLCEHTGSFTFRVDQETVNKPVDKSALARGESYES
jgi:hypothetical protein